MGMDPRTKALEEVNEIKNLRKLRTWPKHTLGTLELGFHGLNTSMVHILSVSHMGFIPTVITNNKKRVRRKEKRKFHSFSIKPHYSKTLCSKRLKKKKKKKKNTTLKQKQNRSYPERPTLLA